MKDKTKKRLTTIGQLAGTILILVVMFMVEIYEGSAERMPLDNVFGDVQSTGTSMLQRMAYDIYDRMHPSPYDDGLGPRWASGSGLVSFRATRAVDKIQHRLNNGNFGHYHVHSDGFVLYIQYSFFSKNKINWPQNLLHNRDMEIGHSEKKYGVPLPGPVTVRLKVSLNKYISGLGYTAVVFRDTDWYDHLIHGPLVIPVNNFE
mgnify:CR=1 FL=1